MKLIKQHAAALHEMVGKMHADLKTTTHDMRNVPIDATNKFEAIPKSKDDMVAKVEEMKQIRSERSQGPGTDTHNSLHKRCDTLEQLDQVERAFSTQLHEVKKQDDHHGG